MIARIACILFLLAIAVICYRRPVPNDFDRYIYEAIVRGKSQPIEVVYSIVKHENPRAEASLILDSPQHLRELEPLYAIRPLYLATISSLGRITSIQSAINFVSAASMFGIGMVCLWWTKRPVETGLLMAAFPIVSLGRFGTPDAMAALLAVAGFWIIAERIHQVLGLALLLISIGVRTDSVLIVLTVVAWLSWEKRISATLAGLVAILAFALVLLIDHWAGSYGWITLFRFSFIGGGEPSQLPNTLSIREYGSAFAHGAISVFNRVALWLLVGILAWRRERNGILVVALIASSMHFLLFPSPEDRYLVWSYIVAGIALVRSASLVRNAEPDRSGIGAVPVRRQTAL